MTDSARLIASVAVAVAFSMACSGPSSPLPTSAAPTAAVSQSDAARRDQIRADLRRLDAELQQHGGSWDAWADRPELVAFRSDLQRWIDAEKPVFLTLFEARDRFVYSETAMRLVNAGNFMADTRYPSALETLVALSSDLRNHGIDFIYMPVPTSVEVYPEYASDAVEPGEVLAPYQRRFLHALVERDVEVLDLLPGFLEIRRRSPEELLYQPRDLHWSNVAVRHAVTALAERLRRYQFSPPGGAVQFETRELAMRTEGEYVSRLSPEVQATYPLVHFTVRQVFLPDGSPYVDASESPVLVTGDSFSYIINDGKNLRDGDPKTIINDPLVRNHYLASTFRGDEFG